MAILECKGLSKSFGGVKALEDINLSLESGRIVGLLGPNGSGKTTFIKLINGLLSPSRGELLIDGQAPGIESKKIVSYLPDRISLPEWMNPKQLVDYFGDFFADFRKDRAKAMMEELAIPYDKPIRNLSKGTREKVQLILTMSRQAKLYVLDEPIGGVDPATRDYILRTIVGNYDPEATILISTHLITDVEPILDDVIFLKEGRINMISSVDEIRETYKKSVDELFREVFRCWGN